MHTFTDSSGRIWKVEINVNALKQVRSLSGVDLMEAVGGRLLEKLAGDPVLLCDVLYCLCKNEADARKISDEDFGRGLSGDAIDEASKALLEELVDFFPQAKRRVLAKAMCKLNALQTRVLEVAEAKLDSTDLDKEMERALTGYGNISGNLPESQG